MKSGSVRFSLAMLAVVCVLPIMVMVTVATLVGYQREEAQVAENTLSRARAVVSAVDRDFGIAEATLLGLATSTELAKTDLAEFHSQATVALSNLGAESIGLLDRTGQLVLTTSRPFGSPLPKVAYPDLLQRLLKTGTPGASDLFLDPIDDELVYAIVVPVKRNGSVLYSLYAIVSPTHFLGLLSEQKFSASWRASIIDSSANIVARTHEMTKFLGKKVVPDLLQRMSESSEGSFETETLDGITALTVFSRSAVTGWTVGIGAPLGELNAGIHQTLALMLALTLITLSIGLALAWLIGGRIVRAFNGLIEAAKALGTGKPVAFKRMPVTEANEVGDALLEAARLMAQANQAKADFLSNMSHELRTPLNAILGFAQLMESSSPAPTQSQSNSLSQILKAGWHLLDLVNEILNLALIKSDKVVPELDSVALSEVILECEVMIRPQANKAGIKLIFVKFDIPYMVRVDRFWLNQCLINLLSNAINYNKPNGEVIVECTQSNSDSVRISVRDSGAGLAPHQLSKLFQPFDRLGRAHGVEKGTGISLVVTKRLVELMGGAIGVESTVGVGSIFWIELNLMQPNQP